MKQGIALLNMQMLRWEQHLLGAEHSQLAEPLGNAGEGA